MVTALWLARPSTVLLLAASDEGAIPYVRRVPHSEYREAADRQQGYSQKTEELDYLPVDHVRFDSRSRHRLNFGSTQMGERYAIVNPMVPIGLIWTQKGSESIEQEMSQVFVDPNDATEAAAIVVRWLERQIELRGH